MCVGHIIFRGDLTHVGNRREVLNQVLRGLLCLQQEWPPHLSHPCCPPSPRKEGTTLSSQIRAWALHRDSINRTECENAFSTIYSIAYVFQECVYTFLKYVLLKHVSFHTASVRYV